MSIIGFLSDLYRKAEKFEKAERIITLRIEDWYVPKIGLEIMKKTVNSCCTWIINKLQLVSRILGSRIYLVNFGHFKSELHFLRQLGL